MMTSKKIIVIGAGAAGLMSGITAAENGASVTVIEKNKRVGRKIMITGKGRCNLTNNCDVQTFISNVAVNGKFLYSALSAFPPRETMAFFEESGVKLKTERGGRVFPLSDKSLDVVDALHDRALKSGCRIVCDTAKEVVVKDRKVVGVRCAQRTRRADGAIVCCGGMSYPLTGSTGDGYELALDVGHTIVAPKPSLVPLTSEDADCGYMQGLSLKNTGLKILDTESGNIIFEDFGEMLFTHFGMSGPMILSASSHIRDMVPNRYTAIIDLKPALNTEQLDRRVLNDFRENLNRDVSNSFSRLLPRKIIIPVLRRWGVPFDKKCNSVTKEERRALCKILKHFAVSISGFRPLGEAIVTSGGVETSQINPKTMESKLVKGLYFAGEVIDCDAHTGGFNLQIAWSTGRLAGESCALLTV